MAGAHDAAQRASGVHGFWVAIGIFVILATIHIARLVFDTYLTQRFIIRWRVWLTHRLTGDWLADRAYYRGRFAPTIVDNPDQRIQQDIDILTTGVGTGPNVPTYYSQSMLLFGAVNALVSVVSFTAILWRLSGPLNLFGFEIPKALFLIVIAYVVIASVIAFWIGHPLIRLSFLNEQTNAAFRYALVRLRDSAEAVAFYRGERAERELLDKRFASVITNYRRYVRRTIGLIGWNYSATEAILPLPFIVQAPRLFAGAIKLGDVTQSATAFGKIQSGLSFFRNAYSQFASYNAAIIRLHGLAEANDGARRQPTLTTGPSLDGSVQLDGVAVHSLAGDLLIDPLDLRLERGESMVITGSSGSGKTTLLRTLAQLWPAHGRQVEHTGRRRPHDVRVAAAVPAAGRRACSVVLPGRPTASSTTCGSAMCSPRSRWPTCATGLARSRTGPRCSHPVSSSALRSHAWCCTDPMRCSSTKRRPRWRRASSSDCTNYCVPSCRTPSWSVSGTTAPSNSTTRST